LPVPAWLDRDAPDLLPDVYSKDTD